MAFAYVRYVEDGVKRVVKATDIKKFNIDNIDYAKKYRVLFEDDKEYYRAHVICVGDNANDVVKEGESKRFRLPPSRFLDDTIDESDGNANDVAAASIEKKKKINTEANKAATVASFKNLMCEIETTNNVGNDAVVIKALKEEVKLLTEQKQVIIKKNEELQMLNIQLQKKILDNWDAMMSLPKENVVTVESEDEPIGAAKNSRIHLGRNVWLPTQIYNSLDVRSKSDGTFVRGLACAVFGNNTLATSSVTGQQSNRTKGVADPALDPTKLIAIHDIVNYRLIKNGLTAEQARTFCTTKIDAIIASKIADLKRGPRNTNNTKKQNGEDIPDLALEIQMAQEMLEI